MAPAAGIGSATDLASDRPPIRVIAVGGLDPGGGAGLVRDYLTAQALGARAHLVATAWTTQSARGVMGFEARAAGSVGQALRWALGEAMSASVEVGVKVGVEMGVRVGVKVGMVATPAVVEAIVAALEGFSGPVVFDPVLAASSGGPLFEGAPAEMLPLVRRATLVTPNLAELASLASAVAAVKFGMPAMETPAQALAAARQIRAAGAAAVLAKGGHLPGDASDVLVTAEGEQTFSAPRLPGPSPRGTGCALATALTVELTGGSPLGQAVANAKAWLARRIAAARDVAGERRLGG